MKIWEGNDQITGLRFGIVVSRFNPEVTERLLEGALETLYSHGVREKDIEVVKIPGCFEMPLTLQKMAERKFFHALIGVGAVIRGETFHHEHIAREASSGIREVSQKYGIPIGFGVLTTRTEKEALARANPKNNKGRDAARAAIEMATLFRSFKKGA